MLRQSLRSASRRCVVATVGSRGAGFKTAFQLRGVRSFSSTMGSSGQADESLVQSLGLTRWGVNAPSAKVYHNLSAAEVNEHELARKEAVPIDNGTLVIDTAPYCGRSPKDRFWVNEGPSAEQIDWGDINQPISRENFDKLHAISANHLSKAEDLYVFDGFVGASDASRIHVRVVTELAWQHHFVTNMFRNPESEGAARELAGAEPDLMILNSCRTSDPEWKSHGLNSEVFVAAHADEGLAVIGGTSYGGEMKKGAFSLMNLRCPLNGVLTMHCSANKDPESGNTALFFGLSGTGKTTLSADPKRLLIGDDEHGWDEHGIWNLEGGCYAKTLNLDPKAEPDIYNAIKAPGALLENIKINEDDASPDYFDGSKTQNGRVSYPLHHIRNVDPESKGDHPSVIVFLTCDATGVLPPVSKLTAGEAQYHFLSGYTAKVAGTERGIKEPVATFSHCFGAAFMPLHATEYAKLLEEKMREHGTRAYLINTGWSGGGYGVGKRMSIDVTRACVDAVLNGSIEEGSFKPMPVFGFAVPQQVEGVDGEVLDPRSTWADKEAYDAQLKDLALKFQENYKQHVKPGVPDYSDSGPCLEG